MTRLSIRLGVLVAIAVFASLVADSAVGQTGDVMLQLAPGSTGTPGTKCQVTSGPNKGKVGTYTDDGWCEGDWGGTECGASNEKCEDAAGVPPNLGTVAIYDGDLTAVMSRTGRKPTLPRYEYRIVGALRQPPKGKGYIEIADPECNGWMTIPNDLIKAARLLSHPPVVCDGYSLPVARLDLYRQPEAAPERDGGAGPTVIKLFRLSSFLNVPHLGGIGLISDDEWDDCVDRYLDCQIDCQDGGGVFGSVDSCLSHCDAVFDACTFDPF
jgi:hypothetical protein